MADMDWLPLLDVAHEARVTYKTARVAAQHMEALGSIPHPDFPWAENVQIPVVRRWWAEGFIERHKRLIENAKLQQEGWVRIKTAAAMLNMDPDFIMRNVRLNSYGARIRSVQARFPHGGAAFWLIHPDDVKNIKGPRRLG